MLILDGFGFIRVIAVHGCIKFYLLMDVCLGSHFAPVLQVPSHVLMGIPHGGEVVSLSALGEACLRMDLTAIHEILEKVGYKDDEGVTTEVCFWLIVLESSIT